MEIINILVSVTSLLVNLYTLWSVRKTLVKGAKTVVNDIVAAEPPPKA